MKYKIGVIAALAFALATVSVSATDIIEQVLVKVNGEIITKTDLEGRQIAALRQKNPNLRPDSDAALKQALAEVTPAVIVAADDAAKAKAEEVRAKILANEPFARLAADYSDSGSKANGGLVGPLSKSDLSEELQKAISGLKTGGVTPVLRTARGYQIIKIENLSDTTTKPFDEARAEIADKIANSKRQGEYMKFIAR